jgi:copper chaperone
MDTLTVVVPAMTCRHCIRAVTAALRDVAGVQTVQVDVAGAVTLSGTMVAADVLLALAASGHPAR